MIVPTDTDTMDLLKLKYKKTMDFVLPKTEEHE